MTSLVIPRRFNGPPDSGNGGWTAGALAALLTPSEQEAVRVRLTAPPPLEAELRCEFRERGLRLWCADTAVAQATPVPSPFTEPAPEPVSWTDAAAAAGRYRGRVDHPFPTCFSCGPQRAAGDGLHLQPGPLLGQPDTTACTWTPESTLIDDDDDAGPSDSAVPLPVAWAALDCPGGWSVDLAGRPMVLGTMTAQIQELPRIGARHVVVGRVLDLQGRKAWTETALYAIDPTPRLLGRAHAVWIAIDPTAITPPSAPPSASVIT